MPSRRVVVAGLAAVVSGAVAVRTVTATDADRFARATWRGGWGTERVCVEHGGEFRSEEWVNELDPPHNGVLPGGISHEDAGRVFRMPGGQYVIFMFQTRVRQIAPEFGACAFREKPAPNRG